MPKEQGNKEFSKLPQGQSDRYSSVGQSQVGGTSRPYPEYPNRGSVTSMINLPCISSAVSSPMSNLNGVTIPGLSTSSSIPDISSVSKTTGSISNQISSQIRSATSGLTPSITQSLSNTFNTAGTTNSINQKLNNLQNSIYSIPSYNRLSSGSIVSSNNPISKIMSNVNSIQDLNNKINNSINGTISDTITNPVVNVINSSTYGVNQIKDLISTDNVADIITDSTGTTGIGYKVANEIRNLTNGDAIAGILGKIPGSTAAAAIVDLVGNDLGLGGILSDIACNNNFNLDISLDNPLDAINDALENLKDALDKLADAFDPSKLGDAILDNLGLDAIQDALNSLLQVPSCQNIAQTLLTQSHNLTTRARSQSTNTYTSWKT